MKTTLKELLKKAYISGYQAGRKREAERQRDPNNDRIEYDIRDIALDTWLRDTFGGEEIILVHRVDD